MKTTVDIPDAVLNDLLELSQAKTKREAILTAIGDYNRRSRMRELSKLAGTFSDFMTQDELMQVRESKRS